MAETTMPATEVQESSYDERLSYECAFHVLPTVAEGEVAGVFDNIKALITKTGEIFDEESPERLDLAYPIVMSIDGKNRKFTSAYFGWVRFKADASEVAELMEELDAMPEVLRRLIIKLTAEEEAHPFKFHENRKKSEKMVEVVDEESTLEEVQTEEEESAEVSDEELDESLEKITGDEVNGEAGEGPLGDDEETDSDKEVSPEDTKDEEKA